MAGFEQQLAYTINLPAHHKQPAWRWVNILNYVVNWKRPLRRVLTDKYLYAGTKFARCLKKIDQNSGAIKQSFPPIQEAYNLWIRSSPNSFRWVMEALIMARADDEFIAEHMQLEFGSDTVEAYKKLFFDVDSYLDSKLLVESNIFSTCMSSASQYNDHDFAWKLIGFHQGLEAVVRVMEPGGVISDETEDWIKDVIKTKLTTASLQVIANTRLAYKIEIMNVVEFALKTWDGPEGGQRKQAEKAFLEQMASSVIGSVSMSVMNPETQLDSHETRTAFDYDEQLRVFCVDQNDKEN
jgi:hypothetical protein